jgi:predicted ArsR family transcriptional regulator
MKSQAAYLAPAGLKVLSQLRRHSKTVEELGAALRLTPNAVRDQLRKLERAGLAVQSGRRPGTSKPSILYSITREGAIHFSTLYIPVLTEFLRTAQGQCSGKQLTTFMEETGKSLAHRFPTPRGSLRARANSAAKLLNDFGGLVELSVENQVLVLRSSGCPLAALTSENSAACKVIEGLLTENVGGTVTTCCITGNEPKCCFEVRS